MNDVEKRIVEVLDKLKPYLANDGGGVDFVKFEDGIAYVKFYGACEGCQLIDVTLKEGIEMALTEEVPEVIEVRKVED